VPWTTHGHWYGEPSNGDRGTPPGLVARCGGPHVCAECAREALSERPTAMADRHTETTAVTGRRLGRRAPKNAPALRLASFLTAVPDHPLTADHFSSVKDWGLWSNDSVGDCGPVSVANQRLLIERYLTGAEQSITLNDVFDLYRRSGNPNFDPATGADDNGVDMQTMLEAVHASGIAGTRCVAFAKVDHTNLDEVRAAIAIFGSVLVGADLEVAQQTQTDHGLWDYTPTSEWGGHAVLAGRYTSATSGADLSVVTWARVVATTDKFWKHQVSEAWVVIWPEHLGTTQFQQGVDQAQLAADYEALTGRPFPGANPTPLQPAPTPADLADRQFAAALRPWVSQHHTGANALAAQAAKAWLTARGL